MREKYEKIIKFEPAYDKRNEDPNKNYGIHGVNVRFILKGKKGAISFVLFTNWQLPHVTEEFLKGSTRGGKIDLKDSMFIKTRFLPLPADVGYHSPKPMYKGQAPLGKNCPYLDNKPCYYDSSSLEAEEVYKILLEKGSKGIWKELKVRYKDIFK